MFISNKYYRIYSSIVQSALGREKNIFFEQHHIIPRCAGGSNDFSNLVYLTYREHFICHKLLVKCMLDVIKAKRMFSAMCMVSSNKLQRCMISSKNYEYYRKQGISALTGTKHTEETKLKIKIALTGKKHTEIRKQKISKTLSVRNIGSNNPNAKVWKITNSKTSEFFVCNGNLLKECSARGLSGYLLLEKYRKNKPPATRGSTAYWFIESLL